MSNYENDPIKLEKRFCEFASSYFYWALGPNETARRIEPSQNLIVTASEDCLVRVYFSFNPKTGSYELSSRIRFYLEDIVKPISVNIVGEGFGMSKKNDDKIDDQLSLVFEDKYNESDTSVVSLWMYMEGRGIFVNYDGKGSFEDMGFSDRTNPISGPESVPLRKVNFEDPETKRIKTKELNGSFVAVRNSDDRIYVVRIGINNEILDEIIFPLHVDRQSIVDEIIPPELVTNPLYADPKVDRIWKALNYKELTGIDWIRHYSESSPDSESLIDM